jgi:tetratricopeptide (TPR) repeat protein
MMEAQNSSISVDLTLLFEHWQSSLELDTEGSELILFNVAAAYRLTDRGDGVRLMDAARLLQRICGPMRKEALVLYSVRAIDIAERTGQTDWLDKGFHAAEEALTLLNPVDHADFWARAYHHRGLARIGPNPTAEELQAAIKDLETAYSVWNSKGSALDRWLNRLAVAFMHGLGEGKASASIRASSVRAALEAYRQAWRVMRAEYPEGEQRTARQAREFVERILRGPLGSRLAMLDLIWEFLSDQLLLLITQVGVKMEDILGESFWVPIEAIPKDWRLPRDSVPSEVPHLMRYLIVRWEYAWARQARFLCAARLQEKVVSRLELYLTTHSEDADTHYQLGILHFFAGDNDRARVFLEQAIQIRPQWTLVHQLLGGMYSK